MILYPFQPDLPFGYSVTGFDEEKKRPVRALSAPAGRADP